MFAATVIAGAAVIMATTVDITIGFGRIFVDRLDSDCVIIFLPMINNFISFAGGAVM